MIKNAVILLSSCLGSVCLVTTTWAQTLSLGEQYVLRGYTGQAFGVVIADVLKVHSPAIITNNSSICASLSSAIASQLIARGGGPVVVAVNSPEEMGQAVSANLNAPAIALNFGGTIDC